MNMMPDRHECYWKELYYEKKRAYDELVQMVFDYQTMTAEEFKLKHSGTKKTEEDTNG